MSQLSSIKPTLQHTNQPPSAHQASTYAHHLNLVGQTIDNTTPRPYLDIIHHPRPVSPQHPPMSRENRAAQFAPYAALVGHKDLVQSIEDTTTFDTPTIVPDETFNVVDYDPVCDDIYDDDFDQSVADIFYDNSSNSSL